jgi:hypothetical protein
MGFYDVDLGHCNVEAFCDRSILLHQLQNDVCSPKRALRLYGASHSSIRMSSGTEKISLRLHLSVRSGHSLALNSRRLRICHMLVYKINQECMTLEFSR